MTATLRVTILGCGSSGGVPRIGDDWGDCDPAEPKNRRSRCGLLLQRWRGAPSTPAQATTVLIDTAPELREQLVPTRVRHVDAVFYSHDHADQAHGIDDLRVLAMLMRRRVPVYMNDETRASLRVRFGYCFEGAGGYPAVLEDAGALEPAAPVRIDGPGGPIEALPLSQDHGDVESLGFRVGDFAYSNDLVRMPERTFAALDGLRLWIVDALRYKPHPTHANVETALAWIARLKPRRAVLTNLHVDLDYRRLAAELPPGVEPAYDGWTADLPASDFP